MLYWRLHENKIQRISINFLFTGSTLLNRIDPSFMSTFINFAIKSEYSRIAELGDKLGEM
ncbi:hypothetical protein JCM10550A_22080 [Methanogenium cariaci]